MHPMLDLLFTFFVVFGVFITVCDIPLKINIIHRLITITSLLIISLKFGTRHLHKFYFGKDNLYFINAIVNIIVID